MKSCEGRSKIDPLTEKRILLAVTGSIAAYKSAEIARLLIRRGAEVRALVTEAAGHFIGRDTLRALTGHEVYQDNFLTDGAWKESHISLAEWADRYLVAPATANTIACLAGGLAHNLVCSTGLVMPPQRLMIAPAMNTAMWENPATQENLQRLRHRGAAIIGPGCGRLACGAAGMGRLSEPAEIVEAVADSFRQRADLAGMRVLISAGPTREWLDDVRYVANPSSGKMGFELARAAAACGASVELILGPVPAVPDDIEGCFAPVRVETALDMQRELTDRIGRSDVLIMAAAVSDYRPAERVSGKIKKNDSVMSLNLVRNPDILKDVAAGAENCIVIGFALEAEDHLRHARSKLREKKLDMIVLNDVASFAASGGNFTLLMKDGAEHDMGAVDKRELASRLMLEIEKIANERKRM